MKKLLIITYYWPPSGGAGVQRWLKLSNYIQKMGIQVYVIAPDPKDASYITEDHSLVEEINQDIKVIHTPSFEPLNFYKKIVGKKNVPTAGMANVDTRNWLQQVSLFLRSNLFIPDPRKYWKRYALKAARKLIKEENIKHVVTSSPPHSVQLIGLQLKKELDIKWTADLRDLWTGIYYYSVLNHSKWSAARDARLEKKVLTSTDLLCTVSPIFQQEFIKLAKIQASKTLVIPNGYDPNDFKYFDYSASSEFCLTYTGTISKQYSIEPLLKAMEAKPEIPIKLRFVGYADPALKELIDQMNLSEKVEFISYVTHAESIQYLQRSFALLLVGPLNQQNNEGSVPAKVFEYMASRRPILYIGKQDGFVAQILKEAKAGKAFGINNPTSELEQYLLELHQAFENQKDINSNAQNIDQFSRKRQAENFIAQLKEL